MAATTTKPAYTVRWKDEENERNLRKLFFAAAADIPDRERELFIGTQFSILYTSMYSPAEAATPRA
jgi:hypothetical protein